MSTAVLDVPTLPDAAPAAAGADWFGGAHAVATDDDLRRLYPRPHEIVLRKQVSRLDVHCRALIAASPFLVLATAGPGGVDCSPRGGPPGGLVEVHDDRTLLLPDWPGNNRLDSLRNILASPAVALLFLLPGEREVFRIGGDARLSAHPDLLDRFATPGGKRPRAVVVVRVHEAFIHCGRAVVAAELWNPARHVPPGAVPSLATILDAHVRLSSEDAPPP